MRDLSGLLSVILASALFAAPALADQDEELARAASQALSRAREAARALVPPTDDQLRAQLKAVSRWFKKATGDDDNFDQLHGIAREYAARLGPIYAAAMGAAAPDPNVFKTAGLDTAQLKKIVLESIEKPNCESWSCEEWAESKQKEALDLASGRLNWLLRNRRFATAKHRALSGDPALVLAEGSQNAFLLRIADKRAEGDPIRRRLLAAYDDRDESAVFDLVFAVGYLRDAGYVPEGELPAAIEGLDSAQVLGFIAGSMAQETESAGMLVRLESAGSRGPWWDVAALTAWVKSHRDGLASVIEHPGDLVWLQMAGWEGNSHVDWHNAIIHLAAKKLSAERGLPWEALVVRFPGKTQRFAVTMPVAEDYLRLAYGALRREKLPAAIRGVPTSRLLPLMKDWLGEEAFREFVYEVDGTAAYSLPMLDLWVRTNLTELDRILNQGWASMPIEKAVLWAVQEQAARKGIPAASILCATPQALYIQPKHYPEVMALFRQNKQTLMGEDLAQAIGAFRKDLMTELASIRESINNLDSRAQLQRIADAVHSTGAEVGSVRSAIHMGTLVNILLHAFR